MGSHASRASDLKLFFYQYTLGRILLHLGCLARGGQWRFHFLGIQRKRKSYCFNFEPAGAPWSKEAALNPRTPTNQMTKSFFMGTK
jgi:hypothetical protein